MIQNLQVEVATISSKDNIEIIKTTTTSTITAATISSNIDEDINILSKKMAKRIVTFRPRSSQLDRETLETQQDQFRGFFTLFWIGMAFYIIQTGVKNFVSAGVLFNLSFFRLFSQDASGLILSDACMIGSMFFAVFLQKLISKELIRWKYVGMIIQHIYQILFLFVPIYWTFLKNWPWVQSGFFVLHTISMLMKLHSYSFYNGELSEWALRLKSLKRDYFTLIGESKKSDNSEDSEDSEESEESEENEKENICQKQEAINQLKLKIDQVEGYLNSPAGNIRYSDNITIMNFIDFLLVPTLVYELEYPRTDKIRPWYLLEKLAAIFGTFFLLYVNTGTHIIPVLPNVSTSILDCMLQMLFPFMVNYLLLFYITFECICNFFAELTRFADRNFYDDWWNSTTWDEFARKWNKPVHRFLLRHVYQFSIESYKLSKRDATFMTFFLSSLIHELVMVVVSKKFRMYLFCFQMLQLPLIALSKLPLIKDKKWFGNGFFWLGLFLGPPILGILYCREVFMQ
ncbi:hypothetical protein Glove_104g28 [Diversispora epigaea]|uniref:O-acyltransferase n=1 Tax=Diversispora epigaea TaxID=1348612 RepID=A0A397J9Q6_9GLOM|nr:hypothetical protein Glove_104g28 [Diversispora epigaea]